VAGAKTVSVTPPTAPSGALATFSSRAQDPNWDRARKLRAQPYQARMDRWRIAQRRWKKGGLFGTGGFSWNKPARPPAAPAELQPYVKGIGDWGLAKFFDEAKVARDDDGKFAPKGTSRMAAGAPRPRHVASIYSRGPQWEDREEKVRDPAAQVRPTKDMPHGLRQAYQRYREDLDRAPPSAPKAAPRAALAPPQDLPESGIYKTLERRPQVPKAIGEEKWKDVGRWAWKQTRDMRADITEKGARYIPAGTDEKIVRAAYNHAANVALHDFGLFELKFGMTEEGKAKLKPLVPFMVYARRRLQDLRAGDREANEAHRGPGLWAPFRNEFGKPFSPAKFYAKDTHGHRAGDEKKRFYRYEHHTLVKAWGGLVGRGLAWASHRSAPYVARARAAGSAAMSSGRRAMGLAGRRFAPRDGADDALARLTGRANVRQVSRPPGPTLRDPPAGTVVGFERTSTFAQPKGRSWTPQMREYLRRNRGFQAGAARIAPTFRGTIARRRAVGLAAGAGALGASAALYSRAQSQADEANRRKRQSLYGTTTLAKAADEPPRVIRSRRAQARIDRLGRDPAFKAQWDAEQNELRAKARSRAAEVKGWNPDANRRAWDRRRLELLNTPIGQKTPTVSAADAELAMWERDAKAGRGNLSEAELEQRREAGRASAAKRAGATSSAHWWRRPAGRAALGAAGIVGVGLAGYAAGRIASGIAARRHEQSRTA
jgi:hypothetical protein